MTSVLVAIGGAFGPGFVVAAEGLAAPAGLVVDGLAAALLADLAAALVAGLAAGFAAPVADFGVGAAAGFAAS